MRRIKIKKNKVKKFSQVIIDKDRFFTLVSLDSEELDADGNLVDIEMLRVGTFKHKTYGDLEITDEMLDSMVDNFKNQIIGRDVSFDWNHKAEAASGWLKDLRVEDGVLVGTTELTDDGKESIKKKKYGYFSIEYNDDYKNPESGDKHGPTILGGALTNRPFISNLKKIEFSDDASEVSIYRLQEEDSMDVKRTPAKDLDPNQDPLTLEESVIKIADLEKQLAEVKTVADDDNKDGDDDGKANNQLQDFIKQQTEEMKKMAETIEDQDTKMKSLEDAQSVSTKKSHVLEVDTICTKLLHTDKHHPALVNVVKQVLLCDESGTKVIKFQETVGEGDDQKTVDLDLSVREAVLKILEAIPDTQRGDYTEKTATGDDDVSLSEEEQNKLEEAAIQKAKAKAGIRVVK